MPVYALKNVREHTNETLLAALRHSILGFWFSHNTS